MDHRTCRENLSAYLDGELPREEKALLESHLAGCPECGKALAGLKSLSLMFHKHAMEPVPLSLKNKVFAEKREKPAYYAWLRPALATSMAAAGVLITLNMMKGPETAQAPLSAPSGAAGSLMNASKPEDQQALPPIPRHTGFKQEQARPSPGSSLDMFKNAMPASGESASALQNQPVFAAAGGAGGSARTARSRAEVSEDRAAAPNRAESFASEENGRERMAAPKKVASVAAVRGSARGPARAGSAMYYKAGDKGAASAGKMESPAGAASAGDAEMAAGPRTPPASAVAEAPEEAKRMESERASNSEARYKRTASVHKKTAASVGAFSASSAVGGQLVVEYIVKNYATDNGGHLSSKIFNRFKSSAFRSVPVKDAGTKEIWKSDRYGTFISYDVKGLNKNDIGGPADRSFAFINLNNEEIPCPSTGMKDFSGAELNKQLWDVFEYDSKTYLLLAVKFHGRHTLEYFLLESGKLQGQGAIDHGSE